MFEYDVRDEAILFAIKLKYNFIKFVVYKDINEFYTNPFNEPIYLNENTMLECFHYIKHKKSENYFVACSFKSSRSNRIYIYAIPCSTIDCNVGKIKKDIDEIQHILWESECKIRNKE